MSEHPRYIVVFKPHISQQDIRDYAAQVDLNGGQVTTTFTSVLNGFVAHLPESYFSQLQGDDAIDYIEPDSVITIQ